MTNPNLDQLEEELKAAVLQKCRDDFYTFVKYAAGWLLPEGFVDGEHIQVICQKLQEVYEGKCRRLMIFLPPRSSKSTLSQLFQAWILGKKPVWTLMGVSYAASLATDFSRNVRNIVNSVEFQEIFPGVALSEDSKAANRWNTTAGGRYYAAGIGGGIAGRGAHIAVIDDPLSEQDALSKTAKERVRNWYPGGLRTRLHPKVGAIILISTRWAEDDLPGWLLGAADQDPRADQWDVVEFPAIIELENGEEESYWPEWKPLEELQQFRDDPTTPRQTWHALYMQQPVPAEGALLKHSHFRVWQNRGPDGSLALPTCDVLIMSSDTAFSKKEKADYSVLQVWGIFNNVETDSRGTELYIPHAILLANRRGRWEYPELHKEAQELVRKYEPDRIIIENKASGQVLLPDMRRAGLPVMPYTPGKGQDKISRVQAVLRHLVAGRIWLPEGASFVRDFLEEALAFPYGRHDDQVDAMTLALLHLRDMYGLMVPGESWEPEKKKKRRLYW